MLPLFNYPKASKIDFRKHLNVGRQDAGVVDQATAARKKFLELCSKNPSSFAIGAMLNAVDLYLPHLVALSRWVDAHKEGAAKAESLKEKREFTSVFKDQIEFEWHSCYSDKSTVYCAVNDFNFELGMTLAARAGLLWERAKALLGTLAGALRSGGSSSHLADCSSAAMNLREAAGIWKYVGSTVIPNTCIVTGTSKAIAPPEMSPVFCEAMEQLCLGSGQLLAYVGSHAKTLPSPQLGPDGKPGPVDPNAPLASHSPPSLCASIVIDYAEKLKTAIFTLDSQKEVRKLLPACFGDAGKSNGLVNHFTIPLASLLAHLCMSQSLWDQKRYGEAVAHVRAAKEFLTRIEAKQMKLGEDASILLSYAKEDLEKKAREYQHENSFLYRQPVPPEVSAPDPRAICKPVEFALPKPAWEDLPSRI